MNVSRSFTHSEIAGGRRLGFSHVMGFTPVLLGFPKPLGSRKMMDCFSASWCSDLCSNGECQASAVVCDRWRYCFSYIIKDMFCLFFWFSCLFWTMKLNLFFFSSLHLIALSSPLMKNMWRMFISGWSLFSTAVKVSPLVWQIHFLKNI